VRAIIRGALATWAILVGVLLIMGVVLSGCKKADEATPTATGTGGGERTSGLAGPAKAPPGATNPDGSMAGQTKKVK